MAFRHGLYDENFEKDACGIGLIVNAHLPAQHSIVNQGLQILSRLAHRSALGADGKTSDGAGILLQIPDVFFRQQLSVSGVQNLPPRGEYAVAQIFAPKGMFSSPDSRKLFEEQAASLGMKVFFWRLVPVHSEFLGPQAQVTEPDTYQVFFTLAPSKEKNLFLFKRWAENKYRKYSSCRDPQTGEPLSQFYICSLSTQTIVYKGLMQPKDLAHYYPDLTNPAFRSQFSMVHSRFSTNTLPAWELAQPFKYCCHNGEINTIRGNRQWMKAREADFVKAMSLENSVLSDSLLTENRSDSTNFDEAFELLLLTGSSPVQAMMTLIPEPWETDAEMPRELKNFYAYQALKMEPWDGPAAFCFTDGHEVGACLDRNGLRPCRYEILKDGTLIAGSETGTLDTSAKNIQAKGRLGPGQMLLINLKSGRMDLENKSKRETALQKPYDLNLQKEIIKLAPVQTARSNFNLSVDKKSFWSSVVRFGYHYDEILQVLLPLFINQEEVTSSMGADVPLAILSNRPQLLTNYFRQLFAQVTNPPIDPIREKSVMSLTTYLGSKSSPFSQHSDGQKRWILEHPFLNRDQMSCLRSWALTNSREHLTTYSLHSHFDLKNNNLETTLHKLCEKAEELALADCEVLILTDKKSSPESMAIPAVLVTSAIHSHLVKKQLRMKLSLVIESGEVRDVHQMACLISFGADAIHPYLVEDICQELYVDNYFPEKISFEQAIENYYAGLKKGLLKILSKLGISTVQSYRGAQTFEILGLHGDLVEKYFPGAVSRIGGLHLKELTEETSLRWQKGEEKIYLGLSDLNSAGDVNYRVGGEYHQWNPETISKLQLASQQNNKKTFQEFSNSLKTSDAFTLRGHLKFRTNLKPIRLEEVEPATEIVKRFTTGAMSLGALSVEAHETLALAMNRIGGKSNSGEGGENSKRFSRLNNGDSKNSAIKQIASARFGVTAEYLNSAQEIQIKMAQGAKPGEGGQLPGHKVDKDIARLRHSTPGVTLISPPPHHDIYSIEDLAQLIFDLKCVNPSALVSVKLVSETGVGTVAAGVAKAMAQKILISGDGGGTGASPLSSIRHAGLPWELGLSEAHQTLTMNGLRHKVKVEVDGQLRTGRDVAWAALLGADEFGFATAPLIVEGCVMMRKCHLNTCPVGIATQDPELRKKFAGQPEHLINYFFFVAEELREIMSSLGIARVQDLVGRSDLVEFSPPEQHWKAKAIDLSRLLANIPPKAFDKSLSTKSFKHFDERFLSSDLKASLKIKNTDRAIGSWLSGEVVRRKNDPKKVIPSLDFTIQGSAGQSFGAFLSSGMTLRLIGEANDYVGKGLSGGRLVLRLDPSFEGEAARTVIAGNTCLYGATSGQAFISGIVGERFAVRNSGATAVVEGLGNHGCEYMTGGCVVVLGSIGKNFAAGMSGGVTFIFDQKNHLDLRCKSLSVEIDILSEADENDLLGLIHEHVRETESSKGQWILSNWQDQKKYFKKIIPSEYKIILQRQSIEAQV
jgi:glutamate synthase (NADPH/NADH) large chain/glutamate synthase (ferredoxin)